MTDIHHPAEAMRGEGVSHSLLHMWRAIIAIAHADGHMHDKEIAHFERVIANLKRAQGLTAEQEALLRADMATPQKIGPMVANINDPAVRANLIYFGGILARVDGELHPDEDAILKKLHADQLEGLDLDSIRLQARESAAAQMEAHEAQMAALRPQGGLSGAIDAFLLYLGIDILRD